MDFCYDEIKSSSQQPHHFRMFSISTLYTFVILKYFQYYLNKNLYFSSSIMIMFTLSNQWYSHESVPILNSYIIYPLPPLLFPLLLFLHLQFSLLLVSCKLHEPCFLIFTFAIKYISIYILSFFVQRIHYSYSLLHCIPIAINHYI